MLAENVSSRRELPDSATASMIPKAIDSDDSDPVVETVIYSRDFLEKIIFAESFKAV